MLRSVLTLEQVRAMSPDAAAALWLVRQDAADDFNDDVIFQQWLEADAGHGAAWARACDVWENLRDTDAADVEALKKADAPVRGWPRWGIASAASVAALTMIGGALWLGSANFAPVPVASQKIEPTEFATAVGEQRAVRLADNSLVTLDTGTTITVGFDRAERRIDLVRGQALFVVAHDANHPFVVHNGGRTVTATGTRFEVRAVGNATKVTLIEGSVKVAAQVAGQPYIAALHPGQTLYVNETTIQVNAAETSKVATDWTRGMVTFRNATLSEAAAELNRYAVSKRLLVRDPAAAAIRINGAFYTNDIGRFSRTIAEIYPVHVHETATTVELTISGREN